MILLGTILLIIFSLGFFYWEIRHAVELPPDAPFFNDEIIGEKIL